MTIGQFLLYVAAPCTIAAFYIGWAIADAIRIARYEYWSDRFFSSAKVLVENPDTPDRTINLITSMNEMLNKRGVTHAVYSIYQDVLLGNDKFGASQDSSVREFLQKRPEAMPHVDNVMHSGLLAMTYANLVFGEKARAVLADVFALGSMVAEWQGIKKVEERVRVRSASLVPLVKAS